MSWALVLFLALLSIKIGMFNSQDSFCGCAPRLFEFTFDFSKTCEPINVDLESGGLANVDCSIRGPPDSTDLTPVSLEGVQYYEYDQEGNLLYNIQRRGALGISVEFTSLSFDGVAIPAEISVLAEGLNQAGETIYLRFSLSYSNDCEIWPVVSVGDSVGWAVITRLASPDAGACPAAPMLAPVCSCAPRVYEFTLDFSKSCEPFNVDLQSGGIADVNCDIFGRNNQLEDLRPVLIDNYIITEFDHVEREINQFLSDRVNLVDGSSLEYSSVFTYQVNGDIETSAIPGRLVVELSGFNQAGERLTLELEISYTNDCGVWPVLRPNDSIGWMILTGVTEPLETICSSVEIPLPIPAPIPSPLPLPTPPIPAPLPTPVGLPAPSVPAEVPIPAPSTSSLPAPIPSVALPAPIPAPIPVVPPNPAPAPAAVGLPAPSVPADAPVPAPSSASMPAPIPSPSSGEVPVPVDDDPRRCAGCGGDPHMKTWAGKYYDFHGQCRLLFLSAPSFGNGKGLIIQIETEIRWSYSFISNAVVAIGKRASDDATSQEFDPYATFDILEVSGFGQYMLNGVSMAPLNSMPLSHDYGIFYRQINDKSHSFAIDLGNQQSLNITTWKDWISLSVQSASKKDFGDSVGLMGTWQEGIMLARDHKTILDDPIAFGKEWRLLPNELSFFQALVSGNNECIMPDNSMVGRRRLGESIAMDAVEKACAHWADKNHQDLCQHDVLASGDMGAAHAHHAF